MAIQLISNIYGTGQRPCLLLLPPPPSLFPPLEKPWEQKSPKKMNERGTCKQNNMYFQGMHLLQGTDYLLIANIFKIL